MLSLKIFFKLIPYIWPFLREMVLGNKPILKAVRDNKKKLLFLALILFSFGMNFVMLPRLVSMSMQYIALEKKHNELEAKYKAVSTLPKPTKEVKPEPRPIVEEIPVQKFPVMEKVEKKKTKEQIRADKELLETIRKDFARLKKMEEEENAQINN
jgi:hypothetical protein